MSIHHITLTFVILSCAALAFFLELPPPFPPSSFFSFSENKFNILNPELLFLINNPQDFQDCFSDTEFLLPLSDQKHHKLEKSENGDVIRFGAV